ncbi:DUF6221 family protein [Streptomyces europaeiscabiei]|uniref:DUF6221 family protein n=1 Tax=Streptomyces europaeiscabiei TaxID=146819 RepID=UPI0029B61757|nr:DUF6221 family protein [Streptomyces europaeiscabiei]MDX3637823.1 DUF6221 family protein [Streptomyces europaeiscabiei]
MVDLVQWLRAQLDEDERIARAAGGLAWSRSEHPWDTAVAIRDSEGERVVCDEGWPSEGQEVHIAAWDPARVLREIDAKRQLLARHERAMENRQAHPVDLASAGALLALHGAVKLLALPYADRPGYEEALASFG